jgi:hypothetical protein
VTAARNLALKRAPFTHFGDVFFGSGDCPNTPSVLVGLEVHAQLRA